MGSLKDKRTKGDDESSDWWPYIQPTGEEYDGFWGKNGYEAFEYGYLRQDNGKLLEKKVIGKQSDSFIALLNDFDARGMLQFDIVEGMHIRFSMVGLPLKWETEEMPLSTVRLVQGMPKVRPK